MSITTLHEGDTLGNDGANGTLSGRRVAGSYALEARHASRRMMTVETVGKARRVRIYVNEDDKIGGKPLHLALLELLRRENAHGATVIRAIEGFGGGGHIHVSHLVDVAARLPVIVEWIDSAEQVERLAPRIRDLVRHGLITVDDTDLLLYESHPVRDLSATAKVGDVMSREVVTVTPATPVREVVELTLGKRYRAVPVVEDGRPVGIITSSDLVQRGGLGMRLDLLQSLEKPELHEMLERLSKQNKTAAEVMTPNPVTVAVSTPLPEAAEVMARRRLKRLPVVEPAGTLVGIVSRLDLLQTAASGFGRKEDVPRELGLAGDQQLSRAMRRDVSTVHPETPLPEVFQAVVSTRLNRALVVDQDRRVVGIVTDAELLERITPALRQGAIRSLMQRLPFVHPQGEMAAHARGRTAADLMTQAFATAREDTLLSAAIATMLSGNHKVLAVTDAAGRLVGMVDRADLLHGLLPSPG
jgi:CBS-domain-containing membrane protein